MTEIPRGITARQLTRALQSGAKINSECDAAPPRERQRNGTTPLATRPVPGSAKPTSRGRSILPPHSVQRQRNSLFSGDNGACARFRKTVPLPLDRVWWQDRPAAAGG